MTDKKRGRPKNEGELKTQALNLRITATTKKKLKMICAEESNASETHIINKLIDNDFKNRKLSLLFE